jgi:pimeloyl-ACP methyl ester carboxylesterase
VVCVHGVGVSTRYMVPTMAELSPSFDVFAVDLPGFGLSDKPARTPDVAGLADTLAAWILAAGLDRPALLANSFGYQVAGLRLGAGRPRRGRAAPCAGSDAGRPGRPRPDRAPGMGRGGDPGAAQGTPGRGPGAPHTVNFTDPGALAAVVRPFLAGSRSG